MAMTGATIEGGDVRHTPYVAGQNGSGAFVIAFLAFFDEITGGKRPL